jgi:hypothetical protein
MNLSTGWTELNSALKDLRLHWQAAQVHWNDVVSQDFEANHLNPLEMQTLATLRAMERLIPVLSKVRQDCG